MLELKGENRIENFYDKIIYAKQFGKKNHSLIFHITNTCYPIVKTKKKLMEIISRYTTITKQTVNQLDAILEKYDKTKCEVIKYDCFTQIEEYLKTDDMCYYKSKKKRLVTLKEYKFILQRVTKNIRKSDSHICVLVNNYFLKSGFEVKYKEVTTKSLCGNKLTYILQVLQKHNYLHITNNYKNQRVIQIGPNNPFYMLKCIPYVEEQVVGTNTDRMIAKLVSEDEMLKSAIKSLREELSDTLEQKNSLEGDVQELQLKNNTLMEMLAERENTEQLADITYKTEGAFVVCKVGDCSPVKFSLN